MGKKPRPIFMESMLDFGEDEIPKHIEEYPDTPNHVGMFAVFSWAGGENTFPVAEDVQSEEMARKIADARVRKMEAEKELYGYTTDVYISFPDGGQERVYCGQF